MITTNEHLFKLHQELCARGLALMQKKNSDYANSNDALRNFRMAKLVNVDEAKGILLRMQDKMARLVSFIEKGRLEVTSEGWDDSIVDLINYSVILHACLGERCASEIQDPKTAEVRLDRMVIGRWDGVEGGVGARKLQP